MKLGAGTPGGGAFEDEPSEEDEPGPRCTDECIVAVGLWRVKSERLRFASFPLVGGPLRLLGGHFEKELKWGRAERVATSFGPFDLI